MELSSVHSIALISTAYSWAQCKVCNEKEHPTLV